MDGLTGHAVDVGLPYADYAALHRAVRSCSVDHIEAAQ